METADICNDNLKTLETLIPLVPNFPKPGVNFRDISPLLKDAKMRNWVAEQLSNHFLTTQIDVVVGIDARGFIIGLLIADRLGLPFVMARKPSKLPGDVERVVYNLEYASACLEIQRDAIKEGDKVIVVDDILATGGSLRAACNLVKGMGGKISGLCCMAEIEGLGGQEKIKQDLGMSCFCLLKCNSKEQPSAQQLSSPMKSLVPVYDKSNFTLLYHPSMRSLAKTIHASYPQLFNVEPITWESFPDGYPNIHFPPDLAGKRVVFLASLFDKYSYMEQLSVMIVIPRQGVQSLDLILPYYAPGTMERIETPGTLATADTFAQITSCAFPLTREGPPVLSIFDLHNSVTRFSFSNDVRFWSMSGVPQVLEEMKQMCGHKKWAVAFPDEGSYKRFRGLMPSGQSMIICGKVRDGVKRTVRIMDKYPADIKPEELDHVVIVDDLIQTGGTMYECYLSLKNVGVKRISAYCTHGVFPQRAYLNFFEGGKWEGFENFWITDSIPKHADLLRNYKPFRVISLASVIVTDLVKRYYPTFKPKLDVCITTANKDKIEAVKIAMESLFPVHEVNIFPRSNCESKVPSQPIGWNETLLGANNRLKGLEGDKDLFDIRISMENGILNNELKPSRHEDFGVVVVKTKQDIYSEAFTDYVPIEQEIWDEYEQLKNSDDSLTCGKIYEKRKGYNSSNWHVDVCGRSRKYLLKNAVVDAVTKILNVYPMV